MNILITEHCNKNCDFCLIPGNLQSRIHMSVKDYLRCLEFAEASGEKMLYLLGGEPTLHPQFNRIIEETHRRGFSITLLSNFLFNADIADKINGWSRNSVISEFLVNADFPATYSEIGLRQFESNLSVVPTNTARLALAVTIREIRNMDTYDYLIGHYRNFDITRVRLSLDVRKLWGMVGRREIGEHYYRLVRYLSEHGFIVNSELCAIPRCILTEYEHHYLRAHCAGYGGDCGCQPNLDVFPDLNVTYCAARTSNSIFRAPLLSFESTSHARGYFNGLRNQLQSAVDDRCLCCDPVLEAECRIGCLSRFDDLCAKVSQLSVQPGLAPEGVIVKAVLDRWHIWVNGKDDDKGSFVVDDTGLKILESVWSGQESYEIADDLAERFGISMERSLSDVFSFLEQARIRGACI